MKVLVSFLAMVAMFWSVSSMAQTASYAPQKVQKILQYGAYAVVQLAAESNSQGCTRNSGGTQNRVGFSTRSEDGKVFLANLLTAYAGEKRVVLGVSGCVPYSTSTIPRVYRIELLTD